jgi:hypothetical protein
MAHWTVEIKALSIHNLCTENTKFYSLKLTEAGAFAAAFCLCVTSRTSAGIMNAFAVLIAL